MTDHRLQKSLNALRHYLKTAPRHELESLVMDVEAKNIEGPTVQEYMDNLKYLEP